MDTHALLYGTVPGLHVVTSPLHPDRLLIRWTLSLEFCSCYSPYMSCTLPVVFQQRMSINNNYHYLYNQ